MGIPVLMRFSFTRFNDILNYSSINLIHLNKIIITFIVHDSSKKIQFRINNMADIFCFKYVLKIIFVRL